MRLLAVIPARGGSKGIPRKNLALCAGKRLIEWTIDHARENVAILEAGAEINVDSDEDIEPPIVDGAVLVSTDDPEIAAVSAELGVSVLDRPAELASDSALTAPVIVHAVECADRFPSARPDIVAVLQPTVPARAPYLLSDCVRLLWDSGADCVISAHPLHFVWWKESPAYAYGVHTGTPEIPQWRSQCPRRPRRQDMGEREVMWHEDGACFVARADLIRKTGNYVGGRIEIYPTTRTVDIDNQVDLAVAEALLTYRPAVAEIAF